MSFAATLFEDGAIQFHYGDGNANFTSAVSASNCGVSPVIGLSNGHDIYTQTVTVPL